MTQRTTWMKRSPAGWIALLLMLLWMRAAAASGPEGEETAGSGVTSGTTPETAGTPETTERTYRGNPDEAQPFYEQALEAYDARRYEEAARLLERAFEAHEHPLLAYNLGQSYRRAGNDEAALTAYQRYVEICPRDELINEVYIQIGESLLRLERREEANEAFQHYLDLERDGEDAAQAQRAIESGEAPSAQDQRDPQAVEQAREICDRAAALWEQEQFQQAADTFLRGYERMPEMHEFLYDAGLCYLDAQAWGDAARTFQRYVQTPGAEHDAWAFLGECYGEQFNFASAVETYERYLELEPEGTYAAEARAFINDTMPPEVGSPQAETGASPEEAARARELVETARGHYAAERYAESLDCLQRAYQIVRARSLIHNMGLCCLRMGEWEQALGHFERILQFGEEGISSTAHLEAAECLLELNRAQDAIRHIERYIALARQQDLPDEESYLERARELQQRAQGGGTEAGGQ